MGAALNLPPLKYILKILEHQIVKIVIQIVFHPSLSVINILLYLLFPLSLSLYI